MVNPNDFWQWLNENDSDTFQQSILNNPRDTTTRKVYADYLQEHNLEINQDTLDFLRFNPRKPSFANVNGKVWAGYYYTMDEIRNISRGQGNDFFSPGIMRAFRSRTSDNVFTGPGGTFFITSEQFRPSVGRPEPRYYSIRKFEASYENEGVHYSINKGSVEKYPNLAAAKRGARILSNLVV